MLLHDMLDVDECAVGVGGRSLMKRLSRYAGRVPTCDGRGKDIVILLGCRVCDILSGLVEEARDVTSETVEVSDDTAIKVNEVGLIRTGSKRAKRRDV